MSVSKDNPPNISQFSQFFADADNILSVNNDEQNNFRVSWYGSKSHEWISSNPEFTSFYDVKEWSLVKNRFVLCITKFDEQECKIELFLTDLK